MENQFESRMLYLIEQYNAENPNVKLADIWDTAKKENAFYEAEIAELKEKLEGVEKTRDINYSFMMKAREKLSQRNKQIADTKHKLAEAEKQIEKLNGDVRFWQEEHEAHHENDGEE